MGMGRSVAILCLLFAMAASVASVARAAAADVRVLDTVVLYV